MSLIDAKLIGKLIRGTHPYLTDEEKIIAIRRTNGRAIMYIDNPSIVHQMEAVKLDGLMIRWIHRPIKCVQIAAIHQNQDSFRHIYRPCRDSIKLMEQYKMYNLLS